MNWTNYSSSSNLSDSCSRHFVLFTMLNSMPQIQLLNKLDGKYWRWKLQEMLIEPTNKDHSIQILYYCIFVFLAVILRQKIQTYSDDYSKQTQQIVFVIFQTEKGS